jgi:hypothetical protein
MRYLGCGTGYPSCFSLRWLLDLEGSRYESRWCSSCLLLASLVYGSVSSCYFIKFPCLKWAFRYDMDHWDYFDLYKTFAINSYVTVVERRGHIIFKDRLDIHLRRYLCRGIRCHHWTQLHPFLEVFNYLVIVIDGYLSHFNRLFKGSLLTVLT